MAFYPLFQHATGVKSKGDPSQLGNIFGTGFMILSMVSQVVSLLNVLPMIAMYLQYFNLVEEKEGRGLEDRIGKIV